MPFPPSKRKRNRQKPRPGTLTITSLMDIFTIILLFLLKSYSAEGDILAVDPKLRLPVSTSRETPRMRLIVQISTDAIIVDGVKVSDLDGVLKGKDLLIKPLLDALNKSAQKTEFIARNNPAVKFTGEVLIQGDRRIPFVVLEKVMFTCGQAGYNSIALAVYSRE